MRPIPSCCRIVFGNGSSTRRIQRGFPMRGTLLGLAFCFLVAAQLERQAHLAREPATSGDGDSGGRALHLGNGDGSVGRGYGDARCRLQRRAPARGNRDEDSCELQHQ